MNVLEAIRARQSNGKVKPDSVPRPKIEGLLEAAVQAPNHYKVRPWRFVVISGESRRALGDVMADSLSRRFPEIESDGLDKERAKPLRAPVIIAVGVDAPADPRVIAVENICAAAAACQNILLAAAEMGLASYWRTGDPARDQSVKDFLGFSADQELIAFLYIGEPQTTLSAPERPGFEDRTRWLD